ncbi:MAG: bifunctional tetrahydrofolate synthase/dihydrofolate synthase, partial [Oceanospirillaceae bacterium]|nr:bifunctional tetrahydrofolate synthase/dihydrofolate synthase [Oceanospirillaceae bacterium]
QVILDVAHNPQAAQNLALELADEHCDGQTIAVLAMLGDKDYPQVINALSGSFDRWMLATSEGPRGLLSSELGQQLSLNAVTDAQFDTFNTPTEAFVAAIAEAAPADRVIVFGSFVTVGEVLALVEG